jgi:hypothetical protein
MWRSSKTLRKQYKEPAFRERFARLFSIRRLFLAGIRKKDYVIPSKATEGVVFTPTGEGLLHEISAAHTELSMEQVQFVVFLLQFHEDLLVLCPGNS